MTKNIDKTFMEAYQDLVAAANNITKQTTSIDESMKLFDQGMKDAELWTKMLDEAEQKSEVFKSDEEYVRICTIITNIKLLSKSTCSITFLELILKHKRSLNP